MFECRHRPRRGYAENLNAILEEIRAVGGSIDKVRYGNHSVIYWTLGGAKLVSVASRADFAIRNSISEVRRRARHAG